MAFSACRRVCQGEVDKELIQWLNFPLNGQISSDVMVLKMEGVSATGSSEPATLDHRVVVAVPLAAHRDQDAALSKLGLIVDGAVLRSSIGMMNQPRRRVAVHNGAPQSLYSEAVLQPVTRGPADVAPWSRHWSEANGGCHAWRSSTTAR